MIKTLSSIFIGINLFCAFHSNAALVNLCHLQNGDSAQIKLLGEVIEDFEGTNGFIQIDPDLPQYFDEAEGYELFIKKQYRPNYECVGSIYFHEQLPNKFVLLHRDGFSPRHAIQPIRFDAQYLTCSSNAQPVNNLNITIRQVDQPNIWNNINYCRLYYNQYIVRITLNHNILTNCLIFNFEGGQRYPIGDVGLENVMVYGEARINASFGEILRLVPDPANDEFEGLFAGNINEQRTAYLELLRNNIIDDIKLKINELRPNSNAFIRASTRGQPWANELDNALVALDRPAYPTCPRASFPNFQINDNLRRPDGENIGVADLLVKVVNLINHYPFPDLDPALIPQTRIDMMRTLIINLGQCIEDDGHRVCGTGKLKRLITTLQGYIPNVTLDAVGDDDLPNVKDVFTVFINDIDLEMQNIDYLSDLFYIMNYDFIDTAEHYQEFLNKFKTFTQNKRAALKEIATLQFRNHPIQKIQLRRLFENHINTIWARQLNNVKKEFNDLHQQVAPGQLPININIANPFELPIDNFALTTKRNNLIDTKNWLENNSWDSNTILVRKLYPETIEHYRNHCGYANKDYNFIIEKIINLNNPMISDMVLTLYNTRQFNVPGYEEQTNTNNNETLIYVWHLLEKLYKNDAERLQILCHFFEQVTPRNPMELAVYSFKLLKDLLEKIINRELELTLCLLKISQIQHLPENQKAREHIDFTRKYNQFLTDTHRLFSDFPSRNFDLASALLIADAEDLRNVLNKFNEIHAFGVPGYNAATNTNIKESFFYIYQLCLKNDNFQPLVNVLRQCDDQSIDELAYHLVATWARLQYQSLLAEHVIM